MTLRSAGRAVLAMAAALAAMLTMALAAIQPARADAMATGRTAARTPDGATGGETGGASGAAGTFGGANFRLTGHVDLNKYGSVSIDYLSDDGSLAVVDATSGEDDVEHLLVTLKDVSITDLDDSYGSGYIASHDGKRLYYPDKDNESVEMMDVASKKTTTLTGLDWDDDSYLMYAAGDRLLVSSTQGDLRLYDVAQRKETVKRSVGGDSYALAYDDDLSAFHVLEYDGDGSHMVLRTYDAARGGKGESKRLTLPDGLDDDLDEDAGSVSVLPFVPRDGEMMLGVGIAQDGGFWVLHVCSVDVKSGRMTTVSEEPGIYVTNNRRYLLVARAESGDLDDAGRSLANGKADDVSAFEVWDSVSGRMVRQTTDYDAMQDIVDRADGDAVLYPSLSSDGRYLFASSGDDAERSRITVADLSTGKTEDVELPESDDVSFGKDGFGHVSISTDSGTLVAMTDLPDGQRGKRLMIYSTGIGGSAWANPVTWILIGVGVAAAVGVTVAVILVARARRRRRATRVAGVFGVAGGAAGVPAGVPGAQGVPGMPDAPAPVPVPSGVPGASGTDVRSVPVAPPLPDAVVPASTMMVPVQTVPAQTVPVPTVASSPAAPGASAVGADVHSMTPGVSLPSHAPMAPAWSSQSPSSPSPESPRPRFCTQCGAALPDAGARFCPQCGSAL